MRIAIYTLLACGMTFLSSGCLSGIIADAGYALHHRKDRAEVYEEKRVVPVAGKEQHAVTNYSSNLESL